MRKPINGPEAERFLEALSAEVINWGSNIPLNFQNISD
jgi:hypothetical protein